LLGGVSPNHSFSFRVAGGVVMVLPLGSVPNKSKF